MNNVIQKMTIELGTTDIYKYCTTHGDTDSSTVVPCFAAFNKALGIPIKPNCTNSYSCMNPTLSRDFNTSIRTYNDKSYVKYTSLQLIGFGTFRPYRLNEGSYIQINIGEGQMYFNIDTNASKKPNKLGHDVFVFKISAKSRLEGLAQYFENSEDDLQAIIDSGANES